MPPVGIVTGASRGLGLALTRALAERGWRLVVDGRDAPALAAAVGRLAGVDAIPGDVTDDWHRNALVAAAGPRIDLLVNNAGALGPAPLPPLAAYALAALRALSATTPAP
jgi:NAD(P)-dependent dehydrogenase (short-subunit alcohol dehydrogenase family)